MKYTEKQVQSIAARVSAGTPFKVKFTCDGTTHDGLPASEDGRYIQIKDGNGWFSFAISLSGTTVPEFDIIFENS